MPETQQVMGALLDAKEQARFIGGCVRDAILKRPVQDVDIATPATPERVIEILEKANIRVIPTGLSHGTVTAVINHEHFEITTLRIDVNTDGRRAEVSFTNDWTRDAARRDFTINAMSCDLDGNVYDPYNGIKDLSTGYIRFVGLAHQRIEEDLLRLLRFFRFLAYYGKHPVNADALSACRTLAPRLTELSGERVRGELFRILTSPNPATAISYMQGEQVLHHILPEAGHIGCLRVVAWLVKSGTNINGLKIDPVRHLAALLDPTTTEAQVQDIADRFKFSNAERKHLVVITAQTHPISADSTPQDLRRVCYEVGPDRAADIALISWANEVAVEARLPIERTAAWIHIVEATQAWKPVVFPLRGRDVVTMGIPHGPEIGALLAKIKCWWVEKDFYPDHQECLEALKKLIK
ncbi:MAG: CCA tRNA nucleotidyltransferase [Magnetovibrio sp.]|nr:CCA tRNA nucleotidyltransferase [Magnetovibrio sp.]